MNCDIDIGKLAELTATGHVYWCGDYFGLLHDNLVAADDPHKNTLISSIRHAIYIQDSISYWLTYYHAADAENDFLQAIKYTELIELAGYKGYTIYDGDEIVLLKTVLSDTKALEARKSSAAEIETYDGYLRFWRDLLTLYEKQEKDKDAWELADYVHREHGDAESAMNLYVRSHKCPVCGYYFVSTEYQCCKCGFSGINQEFLSKKDYDEWFAEQVTPAKQIWKAKRNSEQILIHDNGLLISLVSYENALKEKQLLVKVRCQQINFRKLKLELADIEIDDEGGTFDYSIEISNSRTDTVCLFRVDEEDFWDRQISNSKEISFLLKVFDIETDKEIYSTSNRVVLTGFGDGNHREDDFEES